eukprot:15758345-Heterocapsa_arctica.AAC.1
MADAAADATSEILAASSWESLVEMYPGTGQSDVEGHAMFDMFFAQHVEAVMRGETSLPEKE